jgi:glycine betaine/choline ABC-type transport system substrate-binding protein
MHARTIARPLALLLLIALLVSTGLPAAAQEATPEAPTADDPAATPAAKGPIIVASKDFSESVILGKMYILLLRAAGFTVEDQTGLGGSPAVRAAIESGEIDLYPEYTGTAVSLYHNLPGEALPADADRLFTLAKSLDAEQGIIWLERGNFNNTYTLMVRQETIDQGIVTVADLADFMNANDAPLKICVESEFYAREQDGLKGLEVRYGFAFKEENVLFMDVNETYEALRRGDCEVAEGFATDGRIPAWGFQNLQDTLSFFPIYNPAPVIRQATLDQYPEIEPLLNQLGALLDDAAMSQLNARTDIGPDGVFGSGDEEAAETVALSFLQSQRLIKPPSITVGSKDFTEQLLLGKMLVLLLQDSGYEVEDKTGLGGSPAVRAALESGEIDLYPEYTGTALSLHHGLPVTALPTDPDRAFELARSLDQRLGLVWLERAQLNDTYTLMVRQEMVDRGITTIEELATFMNENDAPFTICVESEFYAREQDGLKGLEARYGFAFKEENVLFMDVNQTYDALRNGECDVAEGFSTDGRIDAWGLYNLEDTLSFFPIYNPAPVIRQETLDRQPELAELLGSLGSRLDNTVMASLNARVDLGADGVIGSGDEETVADVAYSFLRSERLLKPPTLRVASKDYTEQLILGKMAVLVLLDAGYGVVDQVGMGGSKVVREAMERGEIDLYVELTGSALAVHNGLPSEALPTDPDRAHRLARSLDAKKGIAWLERGPFNDTYALMVREELWNQGIQSIQDLADFMNANDSPLSICVENDFFGRIHDGLPAVEASYGFAFKPEQVLLMDLDQVYTAMRAGECDVAEGYSTDGRGAAWGFFNLADPLAVFPFYNPAAVIRQELLSANPELADLLDGFVTLLDDAAMSQLNARVDIGADGEPASGDEETPEAVARDFLLGAGLIDPSGPAATPLAENQAAAESETAPTRTVTTTAPLTGGAAITTTEALTAPAPLTDTAAATTTAVATPSTGSALCPVAPGSGSARGGSHGAGQPDGGAAGAGGKGH